MIDSHCHLDFAQFDPDRERILTTCHQAGISRILIPNTQLNSLPTLLSLKHQANDSRPHFDIAAGLHPWFLSQHQQTDLNELESWLQQHHQHCIAIGETGIDKTIAERVPLPHQIDSLERHIALANAFNLPLILHHRNSHNELIRVLKQARFKHGGVIHAFSGSVQLAEEYVAMGFLLGMGGTITYPRANKTIKAMSHIALENLLLETDAPDMPVNGRQGQRNSPEYLPEIAAALAKIKAVSVEEVAAATSANYHRLFAPESSG